MKRKPCCLNKSLEIIAYNRVLKVEAALDWIGENKVAYQLKANNLPNLEGGQRSDGDLDEGSVKVEYIVAMKRVLTLSTRQC